MRIYLLFFFLPAMYSMMAHMQRQRRKKIGPFVTKSSENKDDWILQCQIYLSKDGELSVWTFLLSFLIP